MFAVRYLLPLAIFLAGVFLLIFEPGVDGWHGDPPLHDGAKKG